MKEKATNSKESPITHVPTPNDQRSTALNPSSPAFKAANDNRSRQLNPKDSVYHFSRRGGRNK